MPQAYYYSSVAGAYTLTIAVTGGATILNVDTTTGLPNVPFKLALEPGTVKEEIVKVTSVGGLALTVVRGWDGTPATAHDAGVPVRHAVTAEDLTLSRQHEAATSAVHGVGSALVGVSDTQTILNKTLSPNASSGVGAVVKGLSGQTGDLFQAQDYLGNVVSKVAANGDVTAPNLTTKFAAVDAADATHTANINTNTTNIATNTTNISNLTADVALYKAARSIANASGASLSSGSLGLTDSITFSSVAYNRVVILNWSTAATAAGNGTVEIELRKDGTMIRAIRGLNGSEFSGTFTDTVAAGATPGYQLIATVVTGTGTWTFTSDARYTWLTATAFRAV